MTYLYDEVSFIDRVLISLHSEPKFHMLIRELTKRIYISIF